MKKKKIIIASAFVLTLVVGMYIGNKVDFSKLGNNINNQKKKALAVYIEGDDGEYTLSSSNKFPTDGYTLNLERSTCTNGGKLSQNPVTKAISMSTSNKSECNLYFGIEIKKDSLLPLLLSKVNDSNITNYNSGNKGEMFTFSHPATTQTEALTDYRYIGSSPNNYIDFNDETWRIIGVFTVETEEGNKEQLIKIIRDGSLGDITWDVKSDKTAINEWSTASLKTFLNGEYYNTENSFTTIFYRSSGTSVTLTIPKGLNATARSQIANVKWYLGGSSTYQNLGGSNYYYFERGTNVISGRSTNTMAKVGLMYPSDYIYTYANGVDNTCYTNGFKCNTGTPANGWLYKSNDSQWLLSPDGSAGQRAYLIIMTGLIGSGTGVDGAFGVRPTVYLNSNVAIVGGDGSSGNHYRLG